MQRLIRHQGDDAELPASTRGQKSFPLEGNDDTSMMVVLHRYPWGYLFDWFGLDREVSTWRSFGSWRHLQEERRELVRV